MPSCKWVMSYVCRMAVNPTNLVLWFKALLAIRYHMFVCFSLLNLWFIIKTKVIVQKLGCDKIRHIKLYDQTHGKIYWFDYEGRNEISLDQLVFRQTFLISLVNQKSGDENNMNT